MSTQLFTRAGAAIHDGHFGERLQLARVRQGFSQKDVVVLAGMDPSTGKKTVTLRTLAGWEADGRPRLGFALRAVAEVLGVSVAWLLWGDKGGPPDADRNDHPGC